MVHTKSMEFHSLFLSIVLACEFSKTCLSFEYQNIYSSSLLLLVFVFLVCIGFFKRKSVGVIEEKGLSMEWELFVNMIQLQFERHWIIEFNFLLDSNKTRLKSH